MNPSVFSMTSDDWKEVLKDSGQKVSMLPYWLEGLYKNEAIWQKHVSPTFINSMREKFSWALPSFSRIQESQDKTVKFLMRMEDGLEVETVLIPFHKRYTVCLSTQVGCAMNCSFCYTGTQGLKRHLSASEIVGQYLRAFEWLKENEISDVKPNIVFMGQGEPLHNVDQVHQAIKVLNDPSLVGVGLRQMTLSTVGYLPGLKKILDFPQINLALSLHSPFQEERVKLIPTAERFTLPEILKALDEVVLMKKQFITFEYVLIKDFNMSDAHADELQKLLGTRAAIMNLIPFNPFPGSTWERPTDDEIECFKEKLVARKIRVMVRATKGDDILAACGQLKINNMARSYGHA